jgi:hypothetical protein
MPGTVSLAKLVSALQFAEPQAGVRIDLSTGEIVEGIDPTAPAGPTLSSTSESERYRTFCVNFDEQDWARRFCETIADPHERHRLETALSSAQSIESFEHALYRVGIAHEWFPFRESQLGKLAKAWLESEKIPFVDDLD